MVARSRVRPADDPDDGRPATLDQRRRRDPRTGRPEDGDPRGPDLELGTPSVAQPLDIDDRPGGLDEAPLERRAGCAGQPGRPRHRGRAAVDDRGGPDPRGAVGPDDLDRSPGSAGPAAARTASVGSQTSIAPVRSWMTIRRPVASSRLDGIVTTPSAVTFAPIRPTILEIGSAVRNAEGAGVPDGRGVAGRRRRRGPGRSAGRRRRGRGSRAGSRRARPSGSPAARRSPVSRYRRPATRSVRVTRLEASNRMRTRPPASSTSVPTRTSAVDLASAPSSVPVTRAETTLGPLVETGRRQVEGLRRRRQTRSPARCRRGSVRTSSWPYGAASAR